MDEVEEERAPLDSGGVLEWKPWLKGERATSEYLGYYLWEKELVRGVRRYVVHVTFRIPPFIKPEDEYSPSYTSSADAKAACERHQAAYKRGEYHGAWD